MAGKPWHRGPQWRRARTATLHRDHHTCQINAPGCTTHATHVDHITPPSTNPTNTRLWFDPNNLRAACANCNLKRPKDPTPTVTPSRMW